MSLGKEESLVVCGGVSIKQSLEARIPLQLLKPGISPITTGETKTNYLLI